RPDDDAVRLAAVHHEERGAAEHFHERCVPCRFALCMVRAAGARDRVRISTACDLAAAPARQLREEVIVRERLAEIPTADRCMDAFVTHPEEGGPFPAVLVLMDIWGLR